MCFVSCLYRSSKIGALGASKAKKQWSFPSILVFFYSVWYFFPQLQKRVFVYKRTWKINKKLINIRPFDHRQINKYIFFNLFFRFTTCFVEALWWQIFVCSYHSGAYFYLIFLFKNPTNKQSILFSWKMDPSGLVSLVFKMLQLPFEQKSEYKIVKEKLKCIIQIFI
jgi:hypothetical protein